MTIYLGHSPLKMDNERKVTHVCRVAFIALFVDSLNLKFVAVLFLLFCYAYQQDPPTHDNQLMADKLDKVGMD